MKRTMKIISILILATIIVFSINTLCFAAKTQQQQLKPNSITPDYNNIDMNGVQNTAGRVMGLIRNVAVVAGVLLIAVLGIKYMLGSLEEKAEYKKSFVPLIVGAIVVMAATQIATMIFSLAD